MAIGHLLLLKDLFLLLLAQLEHLFLAVRILLQQTDLKHIRVLLQKEPTRGLDPRPGFFPPPSADGACPLPRSAKHLEVYRASSWSLYLDLLQVHIGFLRLLLGLESGNQHTSAYNRALHARPV